MSLHLTPDETREVLMQVLYAIAAGVGALFTGLPQKGWKRFKSWLQARKDRHLLLPSLVKSMEAISYQISPNGGGSLRDAIDRSEKALQEHTQTLQSQNNTLTDLKTTLASVKKDLGLATAIVRFQSDIATDATFQCLADGRNTYVSESYQRLLGVAERDLRDFGWKNYLAPDEAAAYIEDSQRCVRERRKFRRRVTMIRGDGQKMVVDVSMVPYPEDTTQEIQSLFGQIKLVAT